MYSAVLLTALVTTSAAPGFGHRHGCYSACHGCYSACYGCYSPCHGCVGFNHGPYPMAGYGWAGGCYGYHGGCYGGYGVIMVAPYYHGGCTGCYGAYGGYSCYGVPVPVEAIVPPRKEPAAKDPLPPIKDDKKEPEAVPLPKEKKTDDKKNDDKKAKGSARVHITVPEGGKLFVDGQHINVPAGTRVFQTPELSVGATFYYDIAIEVVRDGARQRHERRVLIRPGDEVAVDHEALGPSGTYTARVPR